MTDKNPFLEHSVKQSKEQFSSNTKVDLLQPIQIDPFLFYFIARSVNSCALYTAPYFIPVAPICIIAEYSWLANVIRKLLLLEQGRQDSLGLHIGLLDKLLDIDPLSWR